MQPPRSGALALFEATGKFQNSKTRNLSPRLKTVVFGGALMALAACNQGLDWDMRGNFGDAYSTSSAVQQASKPAPAPDNRGVVSYPSYQVVLARQGDTVRDVAGRVGVDATALAKYNGIQPDVKLRQGELLALPNRVAEPSAATGAPTEAIDITTIAGSAIERSSTAPQQNTNINTAKPSETSPKKPEPIRHRVASGETAYSISRLYNVNVKSLAEWNGLGSDLSVREGQFLLIPLPAEQAAPQKVEVVKQPGTGSATPVPPSASEALPKPVPVKAPEEVKAPDLSMSEKEAAKATRFSMPVQGSIIRAYSKGKNDGIDIGATAGSAVKAADAGTVAAITTNTDGVTIVVLRHADGLLTIYANVEGVSIKKGDKVKRNQAIAKVRNGNPSYLHFEVRKGFDSVDPMPYLS
ncbi:MULTISPECIES: M23 family metallopeptidase [Halocynthiibacter]|uniref:Peptidoglycan DD-metalloendopeptidase family protein n=1 Tax=Halocynthiibacter halioticoli TaxID=2986804 RepID=A0AAE3J195_9RHOB|nr:MULTISPECIES: M23 family metallopeptidase [Halocynthiibacter]MCV6824678.1 peptidoglycan DD-metalloendopeptidase family protein [Halocynthiibacter halioticoli]MCW4057679.1 peptidoglycan DD-metalloendopeptidase family protein [Halocynthiibacter sp. SDUM655004]